MPVFAAGNVRVCVHCSLSRACVHARAHFRPALHAHERAFARVENARTRVSLVHACGHRDARARVHASLSRVRVAVLVLVPSVRRSVPAEIYRVFSANGSTLNEFFAPASPLVFILKDCCTNLSGIFFASFSPLSPLAKATMGTTRPANESKMRICVYDLHLYRRLGNLCRIILNIRCSSARAAPVLRYCVPLANVSLLACNVETPWPFLSVIGC